MKFVHPAVWYGNLFYGWKLVIAGGMINALVGAFINQSFGAYFATLAEEMGWSRTALSGAYAMMPIEGAILGPVLGWAIDRFGARKMMATGVVVLGLGFMLFSQVQTLPQLYGTLLVISLGSSFCGFFPMNVLVIHWFEKHRARALSSVQLGLAAGGMLVPIIAWSMHAFGWRWTAFGSGVVMLCLGVPLCRMIVSRPSLIGETVDGIPHREPEPGKPQAAPAREFTAREAIRTRAFWLISLGHGFALFSVTAVNVHAISHVKQHMGYTLAESSLFVTLVIVSQVAGVLLGWIIGDRWEKRYIAAACMLGHMVGLLMLAFALNLSMLVGACILHGVAWGLRGPFMAAMRADYFGRREIGMIIGLSAMIIVIGQVGGPMVAGGTADLTGNYQLGLVLLALLAGIGSVFFLMAKRPY